MGAAHYVYLGPYVEVPPAQRDVVHPARFECSAAPELHTIPRGAKFCPHCGASVEERPGGVSKATRMLDLIEIDEEIEGLLWNPESLRSQAYDGQAANVWLSNRRGLGTRLGEIKGIFDLPHAEKIKEEVAAMETGLASLRQRIEKQFGVSVTVKYGIVSYWH